MMDRTLRSGSPGDVGMSPERIERVRQRCAGWVEEGLAPALQVLVARRGTIVLHDAWGRQGPDEDDPPLGVDSIFPLASLTKPMTASAVMCLVEDGLLGLNRPVQEYVPEFVGDGKEAVMVHHLLTHTSGLRDEDLDAYVLARIRAGEVARPAPVPHLASDQFLARRCFDAVHDAPLSTAPGAEMSYCNYGYQLLALIVSRLSGVPAEQFVHQRIVEPLEMTSTSYRGLPPERRERLVRRAADAPGAAFDFPDLMPANWVGTGSAYGTALDLARLAQMFLNDGVYGGQRILSPASVREMTRNQIPGVSSTWEGEHFPEAGWGYGWGIQENKKGLRGGSLRSPSAFSLGGASMSLAWADPACDLVGVYLSVLPPPRSAQAAPGRHGHWLADLFVNAAVASIVV
jgi:serine-type D-Ala-D-Ala carboxypeptidase